MGTHTSRLWSLATLLVVATFVVSLGVSQPSLARQANDEAPGQVEGPQGAQKQKTKAQLASLAGGNLVSYAEPDEAVLRAMATHRLGSGASEQQIAAAVAQERRAWGETHYHGPNPSAYEKLLRNEGRALAANSSPAALGLAVTGTLRLLTVAVEFAGSDTATDFVHPASVFEDRTCITETVTFSGPLHNQILQPQGRDNYTFWKPSFERDYYERLISSTEGITERVRTDLTDPEDGKPGINIAGYTMRNYYSEQSGGKVTFDTGPKGVIGWVQLPHSEAYYAANSCFIDPDTGELDPGGVSSMDGLPQNPSSQKYGFGPYQIVPDVIAALNASDPNFPWADYDTDGDGAIDHVVFVHAGRDRARNGPYTAHWAHRTPLPPEPEFVADDNGTPADPSDDIFFSGYTMQYEALDLGVLAHEFGHDLGLPDLYSSNDDDSESSVVWFDLMSSGSNNGKLSGFPPSGMSAWTKFALGWTDPKVVAPGQSPEEVVLGQSSIPPVGSTQAVRVNLPDTAITFTEPQGNSTQAWWTGNDQNGANNTLTRDVDLTAQTGPISVSFDIDYVIEEDWDYLFVEVSEDGGQTYTSTVGYEVGATGPVTATVGGPGYPDPNGNLRRFGGGHAYTGDGFGWFRVYHDLSAYAGKSIKLRFRYATDEFTLERGAFIDNLTITAGSTVILDDPMETANGWVATPGASILGAPLGEGWRLSVGSIFSPKYYLLEWRNFTGFDKALRFIPNTLIRQTTSNGSIERQAQLVSANLPGMLVWLRDMRFGNDPFDADNSILDPERFYDGNVSFPSEGPKGGLLLVDSHPEPLRANKGGTIDFGYGPQAYPPFDNWSGALQITNAPFTLQDTPPMTLTFATGVASPATTIYTDTGYAALPAVSGFHDALGYFPGVEALPEPIKTFSDSAVLRLKPYAFSDPDTSVVIPAKGYYPPRTPAGFTGRGAETSPPSANVSTFETLYADSADLNIFGAVNIGGVAGTNVTGQRSGNPGSDNLQYGNHFLVVDQTTNGATGTIRIWNAMLAGEVGGDIELPTTSNLGDAVTVSASFLNAGSPVTLTLYSDFDEGQATFVEGSATNGAIPVKATLAQIQETLRTQGAAGLESLRVAAAEATGVVYSTAAAVDSGAQGGFSYKLVRKAGYPAVRVVNQLIGPSFSEEQALLGGAVLYLPIVVHQ